MSSSFLIKKVTTTTYHLWCDALHARELARQTEDDWIRGTYVRWCVITAWAVLELCCQKAVESESVSDSIRKNLNKYLEGVGGSKVDWGTGLWKEVDTLRKQRIYYIHKNKNQKRLWPDISDADDAIRIVRAAAKDVFTKANRVCPYNVDDDSEIGWK